MLGHRHGLSRLFSVCSRGVGATLAMIAVLVAVPSSPALAQGAEPETPYVGTVAFDTVEARSGAGRVFYAVAELKKGDRVTVIDDDFFTWFRVAVPSTVTATVRQADVEAKGNGSTGVVIADVATVNVLGVDRNAAESFKSLKRLSKGETVRIKTELGDNGRDGDYFLIQPPRDALMFLPPGSVTPLRDQPEFDATEGDPTLDVSTNQTPDEPDAARMADATDTDTAPVAVGTPGDMVPIDEAPTPDTTAMVDIDEPTGDAPVAAVTEPATETDANETSDEDVRIADVTPPADDRTGTTPVVLENPETATPDASMDTAVADADVPDGPAVEPVPVETPAVNAALRAVELAMLPHFAKPVERQPLDEIEAAYRKVATENELVGVDERVVESRLAAVQRNRQFAAALKQIEQRRAAVPTVEPVKVEIDDSEPWAAIGVLTASSVLGDQAAFRVVDPATRRTIAYLRPAAGVDPALHLGQIVGVKGPRQYDPALNNQLIIAQQVRTLDPGE